MIGKRDTPTPPDGGWGWVVAVGSNISLQFALFVRCSGVFFNEWRDSFEASATAVSVAGSAHLAAFLFTGPLAGYLCNRIGPRRLAVLGGAMMSTSFFITSFAQTLLHVILSFGAVGGVGCGFIYVSSTTVISKYFKKRFATANSISNSGSGLTIIILPLLARLFIDLYSWSGAFFVFSAMTANVCACGMLFRPVKQYNRLAKKKKIIREVSVEERPPGHEEIERVSLQNDELVQESVRSSHGKVYRKILGSSGSDSEVEDTNLNLEESQADEPHEMMCSSGVESIEDEDVQVRKSMLDGKPVRKVSIQPGCVSEAQDAINLRGVSDSQPQRRSSESLSHSSRQQEHGEVCNGEVVTSSKLSATASQHSVVTDASVARTQRRPTVASIYLGHLAQVSGFYLFKTRHRFTLMCVLNAVVGIAFSAVTIHFVPMTIDAGISKLNAAVLMSIYGVGSLSGRLSSGPLVDHNIFGPLKLYFFVIFTCGLSMIICPSLHTFTGYIIFAIVFGCMSGMFKSLHVVLIRQFVGTDLFPIALGIFMPFMGIGTVAGPTFAGSLYDIGENYNLAFYITGSILAVGAFFVLLIPYLKRFEEKHHPDGHLNDDVHEEPGASAQLGSVQSLSAV